MIGSTAGHKFSHALVRLIAGVNLADFLLSELSPKYSHALANGPHGRSTTFLWIATSLLLPIYVGFEIWWMRRTTGEAKALLIDGALAVACLLTFIGGLAYAFTHVVPF